MSHVFERVRKKFEDSTIVIPVWLASWLGLAISLAAFISDYKSSYYGYIALPTQKVDELVWLIALLPQVGLIIFSTAFIMSEENGQYNWWHGFIAFGLCLVDFGTDIWFKTHGGIDSLIVWVIAIIESLVVYTLGSEVLLTVSIGLIIYLTIPATTQIGYVLKRIGSTNDSGSQTRR